MTGRKPRLSICIPTYNRAVFLDETLRSIVPQLTAEVELVVSDNASEDNTLEILERYRKDYPQLVQFQHRSNVGADRNYLKAVELATGEYCWLFGSDDIMKEGAIDLILKEIETSCDVYLCGLTLCTYDMTPLMDHLVLKIRQDAEFDLSDGMQRRYYFRQARTTTAFFSFIGSLIVKKAKWDAIELDGDRFIGSLWVHVAKIFGMIPLGLKVKYLHRPLLLKRGDNDSFLEKGIAHRIGISVYGYQMIGDHFFGANSIEARHIRRTIKFEWPLLAFVSYKTALPHDENDAHAELTAVFSICYGDATLQDRFARFVFRSKSRCCVYSKYSSGIRIIKDGLKRLTYAAH